MNRKKLIPAKEVAKKFELPYHTLNYYTAIGLLPVEEKKGNYRFYDEIEVGRRMEVISSLCREGYPLNLIRKKIVGY